ncbi:MAG: CatB-related O-acetyltransferase [Planctomycetota bacterium]|jgi:acetyltransferase-like isoleucine patch superfamily enzyme
MDTRKSAGALKEKERHRPDKVPKDNTGYYWQTRKVEFCRRRDEGRVAKLLFSLYRCKSRVLRHSILKFMWHYMGRHFQFHSRTLRKIFSKYHKVDVGMYSHGGCFIPKALPPGTKVGRYSSIAVSATAQSENHPMNLKSSHAFFFNPALGFTGADIVPHTHLTVGNDVWLGTNAIILPSCSEIGHGAVVGAGSVVNKNIPPYAIVVGNPARVVRYRFAPEIIEELLESRWWDKTIEELQPDFESFQNPLEGNFVR